MYLLPFLTTSFRRRNAASGSAHDDRMVLLAYGSLLATSLLLSSGVVPRPSHHLLVPTPRHRTHHCAPLMAMKKSKQQELAEMMARAKMQKEGAVEAEEPAAPAAPKRAPPPPKQRQTREDLFKIVQRANAQIDPKGNRRVATSPQKGGKASGAPKSTGMLRAKALQSAPPSPSAQRAADAKKKIAADYDELKGLMGSRSFKDASRSLSAELLRSGSKLPLPARALSEIACEPYSLDSLEALASDRPTLVLIVSTEVISNTYDTQ